MKPKTKIKATFGAMIASFAILLLASPQPSLAAPPPLTDLLTLGGTISVPVGINNAGKIAGYTYTLGNSEQHAVVWDANHVIHELNPVGSPFSEAAAINASGQVAGYFNTVDYVDQAAVWDENYLMHTLQLSVGFDASQASQAVAINDNSQIAGYATTTMGQLHAVVWDAAYDGLDLGTLGGNSSTATAINTAGQIVGSASTVGGDTHAFVWDANNGMQDLDPSPSMFKTSAAVAINNNGIIAGYGITALGEQHAVAWDANHVIHDLGTLGGTLTAAVGVNDAGLIIGNFATTGPQSHAVVWDSNYSVQPLVTLGGLSSNAVAINASGRIVGFAYTGNNVQHAVVWEADPTHTIQDLGTLGGPTSGALGINFGMNGFDQIIGNSITNVGEFHAFVVTVPPPGLTPLARKTALLATMRAFRATVTNKDDAKKLDEAIEELVESLDPKYWSADGMHLIGKHAGNVFDEEEDSTSELMGLTKKKPAYAAALQPFIDIMVDADRTLAQTAITDASGGDAKKIAAANAELAKGDADKGNGKFKDAIDHYESAWKNANKAKG